MTLSCSTWLVGLWILSTLNLICCLVPNSETRVVQGQRCLVIPSQKDNVANPTLVLIGGMAQSLHSWDHHMMALSRNRHVVLYECPGQGVKNENVDLGNVTLPFQAETLLKTLKEVDPNPVDLVGFSFGGRVAMAATCLQPNKIRKLHLSGVAADRSDYGHLAMGYPKTERPGRPAGREIRRWSKKNHWKQKAQERELCHS